MTPLALLGLCAAVAAAAESAPFMAVELKMAPFQGADAAHTQKKAEAFLAKAGYKVLSYQDNEAVRAADVKLAPGPEGQLAGVRRGFERMNVLRTLRGKPNVSKVVEYDDGRIGVYFLPFVYRPQADGLKFFLPEGAKLSYHVNPAMKGLWVELDVSREKDPQAAAREFARRYPDQVASADIRIKVEVMKVETR
ncbi:hypothetical protein EPO15_18420 [bacterium]|nr:MAG: hypothetical protein EPO15_18420 [bacterium]